MEFERQGPDNLGVIEIRGQLNVFDELVMLRDGTIQLAFEEFKKEGLTQVGMDSLENSTTLT